MTNQPLGAVQLMAKASELLSLAADGMTYDDWKADVEEWRQNYKNHVAAYSAPAQL